MKDKWNEVTWGSAVTMTMALVRPRGGIEMSDRVSQRAHVVLDVLVQPWLRVLKW